MYAPRPIIIAIIVRAAYFVSDMVRAILAPRDRRGVDPLFPWRKDDQSGVGG